MFALGPGGSCPLRAGPVPGLQLQSPQSWHRPCRPPPVFPPNPRLAGSLVLQGLERQLQEWKLGLSVLPNKTVRIEQPVQMVQIGSQVWRAPGLLAPAVGGRKREGVCPAEQRLPWGWGGGWALGTWTPLPGTLRVLIAVPCAELSLCVSGRGSQCSRRVTH